MIKRLVQDYEYVHLTLGVLGNLLFVVGSVLFYRRFDDLYALAVTMFVLGSALMLAGALGSTLKVVWREVESRDAAERQHQAAGG